MTAGNHVMQRRTGGLFSRLLAGRSPVPADHYRSLDGEIASNALVFIGANSCSLMRATSEPLINTDDALGEWNPRS